MRTSITLLALLASLPFAHAQLSVGSSGMNVLAGTPLAIDGLTLTPSASLTIANNTIQRSLSAVTSSPGSPGSISRLYQFSAPLLFSGTAGINYLPTELNNYGETSLQLAYATAANTPLTVTTGSNVNTTTHYVTNTVTNQPLFVVTASALPDLIPILYTLPATQYGTTNFTVVVDVFEINSAPLTGAVTVYITKDPLVNLSFNGTSTFVGGRPVQNGNWTFDGTSNDNFYILTSNQAMESGGQSTFGLTGVLTPGNTQGSLNLSATLIGGSELKITNNTDADKVEYFKK